MLKRCDKCKVEKSVDDFYKHPHGAGGLQNRCKQCQIKQAGDSVKSRWITDPEFRQRHMARVIERNRERYKEDNDYRAWNIGYVRHRQLMKKKATPPWVNIVALEAFYKEAVELSKSTGVKHEVDHIWPIKNDKFCGLHVPCNLQVITRSANRSKNNKVPSL